MSSPRYCLSLLWRWKEEGWFWMRKVEEEVNHWE